MRCPAWTRGPSASTSFSVRFAKRRASTAGGPSQGVGAAHVDRDAVRSGVCPRCLDRDLVDVHRRDRADAESQQPRSRARPSRADVEHAPGEAHRKAGDRVRGRAGSLAGARAERVAWSITTATASPGALVPRRPHHSGPTRTGRWKCRRGSSSLFSDDHDPRLRNAARTSLGRLAVGGELDAVRNLSLLEPSGRLDENCAPLSASRGADDARSAKRVLQPGEEPFVGAVGVLVALLEVLEQAPLLSG